MEVIEINTVPTEFYWKKATTPHTRKLVVIPGNPGVIDFYINFIDYLYENFGQQYDVIGVAHAGHSGIISHVFTLQEQIQHKIEVLKYLKMIDSSATFTLIGHSVGAYISLKVVKQQPDVGVSHVIHLFPTFRNLWQGLAPAVKIFILPGFRHTLSTFIHYAPTALTQKIISAVSSLSDEARYITANKINYYLAMNVLYMAYLEGQEILDMDTDCYEVIHLYHPNMYFLYGLTDQYTPRHFYDEICQLFPNGNFEMAEEGVKHAFVLKHSKVVALKVYTFLSQAFGKEHL